jgi:hypothetical protein
MAGPIAATGAISNPTRYGALTMGGEQFTGIWTQRSPYRDAATAYLMKKFYQGSRFDSIWDGLNREISCRLTDVRRPGTSIYNSGNFNAVQGFYSFKYISNGNEIVRVMVDSAFNVQDGTAGGQTTLFTKGAGAGKTRFLGLGSTLYMGDGAETKKWIAGSVSWGASTVATIAEIEIIKRQRAGVGPYVYFLIVSLTATAPTLATGTIVTFAGLTGYPTLNGQQLTPTSAGTNRQYNILLSANQLAFVYGNALYPFTAETGTISAGTIIAPGTLITDPNDNVQMALGGIVMNILATSSSGTVTTIYFDPQSVTNQFADLQGASLTFSGLTGTGSYLNGNTYTLAVVSSTLGIATINVAHAAYAEANDTGSATTGNGGTGTTPPAWSSTQFAITPDGTNQQWKCYGSAVQSMGLAGPANAPAITPVNGTQFWQPLTLYPNTLYCILDNNQNIEFVFGNISGGSPLVTGRSYPTFAAAPTATVPYPTTADGNVIWMNAGKPLIWQPSTAYPLYKCIIDPNQNIQIVSAAGTSGATAPTTWASTVGGSTTDGGITWICGGPGVTITTDSVQYAFSTHAVDGSVSPASPTATIQGPILGRPTGPYLQLTGSFSPTPQLDQIWIWRTPQGQSQLVFDDAIPIDPYYSGGMFTYQDLGIPDTSSSGSGALNPFIIAPVADSNDAPPSNLTGFTYHLQRVWGFSGNRVNWSGGPDTNTGNGATAWPPLNSFSFQARVIRLLPITVQNGALLVFTSSGIKIILGTGTQSNPFYATSFCEKINLANYDALDVLGTEIFLMESNLKVSTLRIEYPFDPQSGYSEVGFPIGDQFQKVTTGGYAASLFSPASSFLSWNIHSTQETAMYVADGNVGWFRLSATNPPESGWIWSPFAATVMGTSAVQSVETSPGVFNLLMGPATSGPINMRDTTGTVWTDLGTAYPSWDAKGVNLLCATGQWTEVAHISAKSMAVGARPAVSVLLGEINPSTERPWNLLEVTSSDPPSTPRSKSVFSDRYALAQNGVADEGDCILTKFDYGLQAYGDELLDWGIFATTEDERKEEAQK